MRPVALALTAIIVLAVVSCGDDQTGAPAPAPTGTPLPTPTAPASAALKAPDSSPTTTPSVEVVVVKEVVPVQSPTPTNTSVPTSTQPPTPTQAPTPAPASTHTPTPAPVPTDTPTSSPTATETPSPVSTATQTPTAASTPVSRATDTPAPTATHTATATSTTVPTATETPIPTPTPTPTPTNTPVPTPSVDPALASYSPLLVEAVSSYPAGLDFVGDGLSPDEKNILDWADSRLFTNPNFLASKYGPDNWPSDVKLASVQAVPLLMLAIDIQKNSDGKHVISWEVDSLDRILDELAIYEGVCISCYGKNDYDTVSKAIENYLPIVSDPKHVHREMLKTFAYFARAEGEGVLIRSLLENDSADFELLYKRETPASTRSVTVTSFGWRNLSFMSQVKLPDGTVKSFPTQVYEIVGGAGSEREAAERWFGHLNEVMTHYTGGHEEFANLYRPYSKTPYSPEPGYLLIVKEGGSHSSTGLTTSAFRSLGLKAEQFLSPEKGRRTGAVEIDGEWYYHDGNWPFTQKILTLCFFLATLDAVENRNYDPNCIGVSIAVDTPATGEIRGDETDRFNVPLVNGQTYRIRARGSVSGGGTLSRVVLSICTDGGGDSGRCNLTTAETEANTRDPEIIFTAGDARIYYLFVAGGGGAVGTYTVEVQ